MTNLEKLLAEVKELDEKATKGPWKVDRSQAYVFHNPELDLNLRKTVPSTTFDNQFISRSRTLLPKLAEVVKLLQDELFDSCYLEQYRKIIQLAEEIAGRE